uniref:Alpha-type protein kinase domain-containing protein n=1 Tax=Eutreptiella gymnastica TaxID=73025 RepID=A0A7S1HZM7_9EUGL
MAFFAPNLHFVPASSFGPVEKAKVHTYNGQSKTWSVRNTTVQMATQHFAEGSNRYCFKIMDHGAFGGKKEMVAKVHKNGEPRAETMQCVIMQNECQRLATLFNARGVVKPVTFVDAYLVELVDRPVDHTGGHPLAVMEPVLHGEYRKHNNNFGFVDPEDRCTPHAFSHFTYQVTNGEKIVVDIQGVGDTYTDPQIHTNAPASAPPTWGQGDLGVNGIEKFFETHRCNTLCHNLGLTAQPRQRLLAAGGATHCGLQPVLHGPAAPAPRRAVGVSPRALHAPTPMVRQGALDKLTPPPVTPRLIPALSTGLHSPTGGHSPPISSPLQRSPLASGRSPSNSPEQLGAYYSPGPAYATCGLTLHAEHSALAASNYFRALPLVG